MALAFLTKGLPAILFLGLTLLIWQGYKKDWAALFSWKHIVPIILFASILGVYFQPFLVRGDFNTLLLTFWSQSIERTASETNIWKRILSLFTFPVSLFKDILPGGLLLIFLGRGMFKRGFTTNRLFAFCCLVFAANIWVYWVSPDSRSRYIYMFHGLLLFPAVWAYLEHPANARFKKPVEKIFLFISWFVPVLLTVALFVVPIFLKTEGVWWVLPVALVMALVIVFISRKAGWSPVFLCIIMLLLLRGPYGYLTWKERGQHSQASKDRAVAIEMASLAGHDKVFLFDSTRISTTISYYLQRQLGRVVPYTNQPLTGDHFILADSLITPKMQVEKSFLYQDHSFSMVRLK